MNDTGGQSASFVFALCLAMLVPYWRLYTFCDQEETGKVTKTGLRNPLEPWSRAARKWRENEEMKRKLRENVEM